MVLTQRDLQDALEKQNEILTATFQTIQDNLLKEISLLKQELVDTKKEAADVRVIAESNAGEICRLSSTITTLVEQNKQQAKDLCDLTELIEERTNCQLRNTLIFKDVPKNNTEK